MFNTIIKFAKSEDGAVTVDWVVLTAALVGLGIAVIVLVGSTTADTSTSIGTFIGERQITGEF